MALFGNFGGGGNGSGRGGSSGGRGSRSGNSNSGSRGGSRSSSNRSSGQGSRGGMQTRSGRPSTGRNPGAAPGGRGRQNITNDHEDFRFRNNGQGRVTDPEHDGRLHHGEMEVGKRGQPLESYDEWIEAHHVPHPGAIGNQNARGPHNIPPESMERIREGGSRGGKAHLGMRFQRMDDGQQGGQQTRRRSSNSGSNRGGMSSRASGSGMNTSRRRSSSNNSQGSRGYDQGGRDELQELRDMRDRINEVLNEIAG